MVDVTKNDHAKIMKKNKKIKYLKSYIAYFLLLNLMGFSLGMFFSAVLPIIERASDISAEPLILIEQLFLHIAGTVLGFIIYRWAVEKFIIPQIDPE
jgi:hypothetical protein